MYVKFLATNSRNLHVDIKTLLPASLEITKRSNVQKWEQRLSDRLLVIKCLTIFKKSFLSYQLCIENVIHPLCFTSYCAKASQARVKRLSKEKRLSSGTGSKKKTIHFGKTSLCLNKSWPLLTTTITSGSLEEKTKTQRN